MQCLQHLPITICSRAIFLELAARDFPMGEKEDSFPQRQEMVLALAIQILHLLIQSTVTSSMRLVLRKLLLLLVAISSTIFLKCQVLTSMLPYKVLVSHLQT